MTTRLPLPTVNTWVGVDRDVLVDILEAAASGEREYGRPSDSEHLVRLADAVRAGHIDVLSRQVFDGEPDKDQLAVLRARIEQAGVELGKELLPYVEDGE